jgi:hypothetical protein
MTETELVESHKNGLGFPMSREKQKENKLSVEEDRG